MPCHARTPEPTARKLADVGMLALVWLLVITTDAAAYLDPGAGSMVFQTIVAALAAVGYGVRLYWGKIKALFVKRASSPAEHDGGMNVQTKR